MNEQRTVRVENEHLGNADQYRVTREVPLPYSFDHMDPRDDSDDDEEDKIRAGTAAAAREGSGVNGRPSSTMHAGRESFTEANGADRPQSVRLPSMYAGAGQGSSAGTP